jgi:serine/threonine protein kinase
VLHRDVKPANILVGPDGRVVLTDFGVARAVGSPTLTASGTLVGSPSYIAPERAMGGKATPAGDLWGLGASLYAAVEGHPPFDRGAPLVTLTAVVIDEVEEAVNAGPLWPVISGLLRKDPDERLDATETERMLRRVADDNEATRVVPLTRSDLPPAALAGLASAAEHDVAENAVAAPSSQETAGAESAIAAPVPLPVASRDTTGTPSAPSAVAPSESRPGRSRRSVLAVAAVAVAAAAVSVIAMTLALTSSPGHPAASSGTSSHSARHPATPTPGGRTPASPAPSSAPSSAPASSPASASATALASSGSGSSGAGSPGYGVLPAGYYRFTNSTGFSIGVPDGWQISHVGHYVYITDPSNGGIFLLIDQSDTPEPNPLTDW